MSHEKEIFHNLYENDDRTNTEATARNEDACWISKLSNDPSDDFYVTQMNPHQGWESMRGVVILAGGKGSRFGGHKHLKKLGGEALLLHVVDRACKVGEEVIVVLKHDDMIDLYQDLLPSKVKLVRDSTQSEAPLVGVMTGAKASRSEYAAFLSCDLVFVNPRVLEYLFDQAEGIDAAIPEWPDGLLEPLHAVYGTRGLANAAEAALKAHEYRNIAAAKRLKSVKHIPVEEIRRFDPELLTFFNVNTPEDLVKAEKILSQKAMSNS